MSTAGGAAAAAAHAAIANAIKASGVLVSLESDEFMRIIHRIEKPLVVIVGPSFWSKSHKYLTSYRGLAFYTKSDKPLNLPSETETVMSKKIHIPD